MKNEKSPLLKQFEDLKKKHPEALLLFRCGDFYETYNEDAEACASILGITLTERRTLYKEDATKIAGFPYHALDAYLPKLIRAGKRVAICDQMENPKEVIKRGAEPVETETESSTNNKEQENMEQAKQQIIGIATETFKALNGIVPSSLNKRFSDAIGALEYIRLKFVNKARIEQDEMDYVLRLAEEGLKAKQK